MSKYTPEQREFLKHIIPGRSYKEIVELFNQRFSSDITTSKVKSFVGNNKLNTGRTGRFERGIIPVNKGTKGIYNVGGNKTSFKKGNKPHNWVPIGSERLSKDGYIQVKIQEGQFQKNWKGKHILIWEKENGSVPEGHVVIFGDGNNRNFNSDNLILVSKKQLLRLNRNRLIQNNTELTRTAIIITDLYEKISNRKKGCNK